MRLSQKHGVNPCMSECYICGETKNEIILTGAAGEKMARDMGRADGKMPRQAIFSIEPCDTCKERGVSFIEMNKEAQDAEPTGRRCLMKEEAVRRLITPPELLEHVLKVRACLITPSVSTMLGLFQQHEGAV